MDPTGGVIPLPESGKLPGQDLRHPQVTDSR